MKHKKNTLEKLFENKSTRNQLILIAIFLMNTDILLK